VPASEPGSTPSQSRARHVAVPLVPLVLQLAPREAQAPLPVVLQEQLLARPQADRPVLHPVKLQLVPLEIKAHQATGRRPLPNSRRALA